RAPPGRPAGSARRRAPVRAARVPAGARSPRGLPARPPSPWHCRAGAGRSRPVRGEAPRGPAPSRRQARDRRRRARRFAFAAAAVLVLALYVGPVRSYLGARDRAAAARSDVVRLQREHAALARHLHTLGSDAATVALARDSGYIFPGETPYRVV